MWRMLKPEVEIQLRNIKGCHERFHVNRDDLAKELEKDKHDRKKTSETWTRLEDFGDLEDLLTFRRPNPCYIPTLDATFVSCHLFDVFPTATNKICLFKTIVCIVCIPLPVSYLTPNPHGPNRGWMELSLYFLDRWVSWRQTNGFRTWRITWRITL